VTLRNAERQQFLERAVPGSRVPVARTFPSDCLTPVMLFQRMRAADREAFLLESVEGGESVARLGRPDLSSGAA
jgi:anthranilate synthase component I